MIIRKFMPVDAEEVSALITNTLKIVSIKDYSSEYIENLVQRLNPDDVLKRANATHFYVVQDNSCIIGCGAIGPYWDSEDESCLFTIFVSPEFQGKGIGRKIIETLEQDDYFLRAKRIEVPASITAVPFYLKLGYTYKDRTAKPDEELLIRLEKHR